MSYQRERAATLRFVNRYRTRTGREPLERLPKGKRRWNRECPIAMATGEVATRGWLVPKGQASILYPDLVARFVVLFDEGKLPDLEAK